MINEKIVKHFFNSEPNIIIPVKNISMVFAENSLLHAMLILKESNYTQIPVLDYDNRFIGLISLHQIYQSLDEDLFKDFDNLSNYKVKNHIDTHFAKIYDDFDLEDVLKLLIDYNFVTVVDKNEKYQGMITRSSILKKTNSLLHNFDKILDIKY
ncbi:MAG: cyclic-di-AMP-binding protein CbpB [Helcococcus sp.]|nr:cyclic-di-AMP-binding protein CbpB [Helcococcus sp.]